MRIAGATLGPAPLPGNLPSLAERPIDHQLDRVLTGLHASVTSVTAADQELPITARVDPNAGQAPAERGTGLLPLARIHSAR